MSFTSLSVYGTARNPDRSVAAAATIQLKLSAAISDGATDILPAAIDEVSAGDGTFTFPDVTPNDDSSTTPTGTYYRVLVFSAAGVILDYFNTIIPHASAPSVNLFSLARINVAGQPAISYGVTSIDALTGPVTIGSPDGSVTVGKTGQEITLESAPGLVVGNAVSGATASSLLVTDASDKLASGPLTASVVSARAAGGIAAWAASTVYVLNVLVTNGGSTYICNTAHTSGSTFNAESGDWQVVGGGGLAVGNSVSGATASSLLVTDSSDNLASGPLAAAVETVSVAAGGNLGATPSLTIATANAKEYLDGVLNVNCAMTVTLAAGASLWMTLDNSANSTLSINGTSLSIPATSGVGIALWSSNGTVKGMVLGQPGPQSANIISVSAADSTMTISTTNGVVTVAANTAGIAALVIGAAVGVYSLVRESSSRADALAANTYVLGVASQAGPQLATNGAAGLGMFYFDPADYAVSGKTTKMRLRIVGVTNATASTAMFPVALYPVSASAGGAASVTLTLGSLIAGSTATLTTPALDSQVQANSGDFTPPAAGFYVFAFVLSGGMAASSSIALHARPEVHNV